MQFVTERGVDIAAIIIEPIQGEGGDNHFRGEWLQTLRRICDENEMLLIFDEVQCGMGTTGRNWCCEHFGVMPDLMAFGKKAQVCGVMAGPRLDEVKDNAFRLPSRLNSTWGGNFTDMVRSTHFLRIIEEENLVENAGVVGEHFLNRLLELQKDEADHDRGARPRSVPRLRSARSGDARSILERSVRGRRARFEIRRARDSFPARARYHHGSGRRSDGFAPRAMPADEKVARAQLANLNRASARFALS